MHQALVAFGPFALLMLYLYTLATLQPADLFVSHPPIRTVLHHLLRIRLQMSQGSQAFPSSRLYVEIIHGVDTIDLLPLLNLLLQAIALES
jgi:hypothetical protein